MCRTLCFGLDLRSAWYRIFTFSTCKDASASWPYDRLSSPKDGGLFLARGGRPIFRGALVTMKFVPLPRPGNGRGNEAKGCGQLSRGQPPSSAGGATWNRSTCECCRRLWNGGWLKESFSRVVRIPSCSVQIDQGQRQVFDTAKVQGRFDAEDLSTCLLLAG